MFKTNNPKCYHTKKRNGDAPEVKKLADQFRSKRKKL